MLICQWRGREEEKAECEKMIEEGEKQKSEADGALLEEPPPNENHNYQADDTDRSILP